MENQNCHERCPVCGISSLYYKRCIREDCPLDELDNMPEGSGIDPSQETPQGDPQGGFFEEGMQ